MAHSRFNLTVDTEFQRLVHPFSLEELDKLEEDTARTGIRVWNEYILVDFEKYEYCQLHEKMFFKRYIPLQNRTEAIIWICNNQLQRKSLPHGMRRYLYGVLSLAMQTNADLMGKKFFRTEIRKEIAKSYSIVPHTLQKYEFYVHCLDYLEDIYPAFPNAVRSDRLSISLKRIEDLSRLPINEIPQQCELLLHPHPAFRPISPVPEPIVPLPMPSSIKDMPEYDPDSEITGLTLTIPVWISSLYRVDTSSALPYTSPTAKGQLEKALMDLISASKKLIKNLKEK